MSALHSRIIYLCLIFITGAVVLSLELIASRILAPFFGVSLYIWTAILSVTLTFLALGYQFGGWMTLKVKEKHHEALLLSLPILSALFIFLSCLAYPVILPALSGTSLIVGSFVGSFVLLAFPLIFLSAVNPILISLFRQSTNSKDSGAGFILFISTLGSVVGVLVTALLMVPNISNFSSMLVNGIGLILVTILTTFITHSNRPSSLNTRILMTSVFVILLCFSLLFWKNDYLKIATTDIDSKGNRFRLLSEHQSHYGNLKVVGLVPKGKEEISQYVLMQDGLIQNAIEINGTSFSAYTYTLEKLTQIFPNATNALILGFGAGVVPQKLRQKGIEVSVVEINPDTLEIAKKYFHYQQKDTKFFFEDARTFLKNCVKEYDIVVLDLFHGDGVPEHLMTKESFQDIKTCLHKDGILISNIFVGLAKEEAWKSTLATVNSVFSNVHFFHRRTKFDKDDKIKLTNANIVATKNEKQNIVNTLVNSLLSTLLTPVESASTHLQLNFNDVPKILRQKVIAAFKSHKKYDNSSLKNYNAISDDNNTYSSLFATMYEEYRKKINIMIPSRILIN
jgi:predicted membrane-bound spermidine synthase